MAYTVLWLPDVEQELARIWLATTDRERIRIAADQIDRQLRRDPEAVGESRSHERRIVIVPPLAVTFRVLPEDRIVQVVSVREFGPKLP